MPTQTSTKVLAIDISIHTSFLPQDDPDAETP